MDGSDSAEEPPALVESEAGVQSAAPELCSVLVLCRMCLRKKVEKGISF